MYDEIMLFVSSTAAAIPARKNTTDGPDISSRPADDKNFSIAGDGGCDWTVVTARAPTSPIRMTPIKSRNEVDI